MKNSADRYNLPARLDHTRGFARKDFGKLPMQGMPVVQSGNGFTIETAISASFFQLTAREDIQKGDAVVLDWKDNNIGGAYKATSNSVYGIASHNAKANEVLTITKQGVLTGLPADKFPSGKLICIASDGSLYTGVPNKGDTVIGFTGNLDGVGYFLIGGAGSGGGGGLSGEDADYFESLTQITNEERVVGSYFGEDYFAKIIDITSPDAIGIVKDINLSDLKIKRLISLEAIMDTDGCFLPNGINNGFGVWYCHISRTLRCHVIASYEPYFNAPIRVMLKYTRTDTENGVQENLSTGVGLGNAPSTAIAVVDRNMSVRYLVPVGTTWDRGKKENYVENQTLPISIETGKQYKLISPFGTQVCIAEVYIKHSGVWQKVTGTDYNATNKHIMLGTIAACPGDGYVYLTTGYSGLVCAVGGLSAPYVADGITAAEAVIALYCPDEGMDKTADIVIGGGNSGGESGGSNNAPPIIFDGDMYEGTVTRQTVLNDHFEAGIYDTTLRVSQYAFMPQKYPWHFTEADLPNDGFEMTDEGYILCKRAGNIICNLMVGSGDEDWTEIYIATYILAAFPSDQKKDEEPAELAETDDPDEPAESKLTWRQYAGGYTVKPNVENTYGYAMTGLFIEVEAGTLLTIGTWGNVYMVKGDEEIEGQARASFAYIETEEKTVITKKEPENNE